MTQLLDVVAVGAGWVTNHRHVPSLLRDRRVRVVGVVDRHADRAEAVARRHSLPHWGDRLDAPWARGAGAATVGTPPDSHASVVTELLAQGQHVLCEKPLATTREDARAMAAAAAAAGRVLCVVHNFQHARATLRARRLLESGALGELVAVHAMQLSNERRRLPSWYPQLRGGLFHDEAPHLLYLLRSLVGSLALDSLATRIDRSRGGSDLAQVDAVYRHPNTWAHLVMNFRAPVSEWQVLLVGSERLVAIDVFRDISVVLPNDGAHRAHEILRTSACGILEHLRGVATSGARHLLGTLDYGNDAVVRKFVDAVVDGTPPDGVSATDGCAIVDALQDVLDRAGA